MWPVVYRIPEWIPLVGDEAITSFGVAVALAAFAGGWLFARRLRRRTGLPTSRGWDLAVLALIAGLIGAKAYYLLLHGAADGALAARGGLVWYGGLAAGTLALLWRGIRGGLRPADLAEAAAPAIALAYGIGRIGCFLVGDDYGLPTASFLGVAFPSGAPATTAANLAEVYGLATPAGAVGSDGLVRVHATQLYEAGFSLALAAGLIRAERGRPRPDWTLFGAWLFLAGGARFAFEFLRAKDDRLAGPLTLAQLASLLLLAAGAWLLFGRRRRRPAAQRRLEEMAAC